MPNGILVSRTAEAEKSEARGPARASIVGMWNFQFVSKGNTAHNPSIPDGALLDFGYHQVHSDGTEIINSSGHAPATENFCLGVTNRREGKRCATTPDYPARSSAAISIA